MEGVESKAQSQEGQDSQIISENVEGFQQCVNEILTLIEQDENFFEIHDCNKSKLTYLVMELWCMYGGVLANQHVHSIKEVSSKTQHVDSSNSISSQVNQASKSPQFMKTKGRFTITKTAGLESSFTPSADSNPESFISLHKDLISSVKNDAILKVEETKVHEPKVLLEKISTLEKEVFILKKKMQNLTDENALLVAEKSNMAEVTLRISECDCRIKKLGKVLEAFGQKVSRQILDITHKLHELGYMDQLGLNGTEIESLEKQFDEEEEEARNLKAEIAKRDEELTELNTQVYLLKIFLRTKEYIWNTDIERLKTELREKCALVDDLNQKHDALMSYTDELKQKVVELEEKWIHREM